MSDTIRSAQVTTRKPHRCWGCALVYPAGSRMGADAVSEDGTVSTVYWCETCQEYSRQHFLYGDDCGYGELSGNDPEEWQQINDDIAAARDAGKGEGNA